MLPEGSARVVGGAVRDVLLGRSVGEIDLASTLTPDELTKRFTASGFKVVPTGIDHGTVTVVHDHIGYEITTLRQDIATDGRHAQVAFTKDWREDAARRDFTFNALYVDAEGTLYDYFNGVQDAKDGHVRFIGDARARINEDYLRILRFFRFYAFFGKNDPDDDALSACQELAEHISALSVERIAREFLKLLSAGNPEPALRLMRDIRVLDKFLPEAEDFSRLKRLIETEHLHSITPHQIVRFAALLPQSKEPVTTVAARLKLSNKTAETLKALAELPAKFEAIQSAVDLHRLIYFYGADACRNAALLYGQDVANALVIIETWPIPVFPIKGLDLVKLGLTTGPKMGKVLKSLESWWIDQDFIPTREDCLNKARAILSSGKE